MIHVENLLMCRYSTIQNSGVVRMRRAQYLANLILMSADSKNFKIRYSSLIEIITFAVIAWSSCFV